jgi:hypothetical protein
MEFVEFNRETGEWDHRPLLDALSMISVALPPGARAFVSDPAHFDFRRYRVGEEELPNGTPLCPKDLLLMGVGLSCPGLGAIIEARYTYPGYPIDRPDLLIRYTGVRQFTFEDLSGVGSAPGGARLGRWIVDEVVPIAGGVRHRIEFEDGALTIESSELEGHWR